MNAMVFHIRRELGILAALVRRANPTRHRVDRFGIQSIHLDHSDVAGA
jgi:hypothetical protein